MRIAEVSIKDGYILDEDVLIALALKTAKYVNKRDALKLIKLEIKASGLYNKSKAKSKKPTKRIDSDSSESANKKRRRDI